MTTKLLLKDEAIREFQKKNIVRFFGEGERKIFMIGISMVERSVSLLRPNQKNCGPWNVFPSKYHVRAELTEIKIGLIKAIVDCSIQFFINVKMRFI